MSLPNDYDARKAIPLYSFLTGYFPDAIVELVKVSVEGNKQHNPGEPLHWARGKSMDQLNTAMRHIFDHGAGRTYDEDDCMHLAKAAWRLLAEIQLQCESREATAKMQAPKASVAPLTYARGAAVARTPADDVLCRLTHVSAPAINCYCDICVSARMVAATRV